MDIEAIIREYIDKTLHMSLATVVGQKPWVCEVHFVFDQHLNLYWRSLASRRHSQELAKNPHVAGNIVRQHKLDEYPQAIYFEGEASQLTDIKDIEAVYPLFRDRLDAPENTVAEAQSAEGHKFYKISVTKWYAFGKFGNGQGNKYELDWNKEI